MCNYTEFEIRRKKNSFTQIESMYISMTKFTEIIIIIDNK